MENNSILVKRLQRGVTPGNFKKDWDAFTIKLNSIGPPKRDLNDWQKVIFQIILWTLIKKIA